jgi:hypothetical protein
MLGALSTAAFFLIILSWMFIKPLRARVSKSNGK